MSVHLLFERVAEFGGLGSGLNAGRTLTRSARIVARDALRTLEALGIVDIRPGAGGGARITHGNPQLFAEALAVQLELSEITNGEILDTQRAIGCLVAERAAQRPAFAKKQSCC